MKHIVKASAFIAISSLVLASCGGADLDDVALKGENAQVIAHVNFANAPAIVKTVEKYAAVDPKAKEVIDRVKGAKLSMALVGAGDDEPTGNLVIENLSEDLASFVGDIKEGYNKPATLSEEEEKNVEALIKKGNIEEALKEGKKIGSALKNQVDETKNKEEKDKVVTMMESLKVAKTALSIDVKGKKENELTGLAKDNKKYAEIIKNLSGKEFVSFFVSSEVVEKQKTPELGVKPDSILLTWTIEEKSMNMKAYVKTDAKLDKETKDKVDASIKQLNDSIEAMKKQPNPLETQLAKSDDTKAIVAKIKENIKVTHEYKTDDLVVVVVELPVSVEEVEKIIAPFMSMIMMGVMGGGLGM